MSYQIILEPKEDLHVRKSSEYVVIEGEYGDIKIAPDHLEILVAAVGLLRALRNEKTAMTTNPQRYTRVRDKRWVPGACNRDDCAFMTPEECAQARRVEGQDGGSSDSGYDDRDQT